MFNPPTTQEITHLLTQPFLPLPSDFASEALANAWGHVVAPLIHAYKDQADLIIRPLLTNPPKSDYFNILDNNQRMYDMDYPFADATQLLRTFLSGIAQNLTGKFNPAEVIARAFPQELRDISHIREVMDELDELTWKRLDPSVTLSRPPVYEPEYWIDSISKGLQELSALLPDRITPNDIKQDVSAVNRAIAQETDRLIAEFRAIRKSNDPRKRLAEIEARKHEFASIREYRQAIRAAEDELDELGLDPSSYSAETEQTVSNIYAIARDHKAEVEKRIRSSSHLVNKLHDLITAPPASREIKELYRNLAYEMNSLALQDREESTRLCQEIRRTLVDRNLITPRQFKKPHYPNYMPLAVHVRLKGAPYSVARTEKETHPDESYDVTKAKQHKLTYAVDDFDFYDGSSPTVTAIMVGDRLVPKSAFIAGLIRKGENSEINEEDRNGKLTVMRINHQFIESIPYLQAFCDCGGKKIIAWEEWRTQALTHCGCVQVQSPNNLFPTPGHVLEAWAEEDELNTVDTGQETILGVDYNLYPHTV